MMRCGSAVVSAAFVAPVVDAPLDSGTTRTRRGATGASCVRGPAVASCAFTALVESARHAQAATTTNRPNVTPLPLRPTNVATDDIAHPCYTPDHCPRVHSMQKGAAVRELPPLAPPPAGLTNEFRVRDA